MGGTGPFMAMLFYLPLNSTASAVVFPPPITGQVPHVMDKFPPGKAESG